MALDSVISPHLLSTATTPEFTQPAVLHHVEHSGELPGAVLSGALDLIIWQAVHGLDVHFQVPCAVKLFLAHGAPLAS